MTFLRVVAPHFVAGVEFDERGIAVTAAPILHWVVRRRWTLQIFLHYINRLGWTSEQLSEAVSDRLSPSR